MKQIKTITYPLNRAEEFDNEVNAALADGWELTKRAVLGPSPTQDKTIIVYAVCYAELEKEIITDKERGCENCLHGEKDPHEEPCCGCSEDCDKWEAAT